MPGGPGDIRLRETVEARITTRRVRVDESGGKIFAGFLDSDEILGRRVWPALSKRCLLFSFFSFSMLVIELSLALDIRAHDELILSPKANLRDWRDSRLSNGSWRMEERSIGQ